MSAYVPRAAVREADRLLQGSVFLLVLAAGLASLPARPAGVEGALELCATRAFVQAGRLALEAEGAARLVAVDELEQGERLLVVAADGRRLLAPPVGRLASAAPFVAAGELAEELLGREEGAQLTPLAGTALGLRDVLSLALLAVLFVAAARRLGASRPSAWLGAASLGLATYLWPQAQAALGDPSAALLLFLALHLVLYLREKYERLQAPRARELLGLGAALGGAFLVRPDLAPALCLLLGAGLLVLHRGRRHLLEGRPGLRRVRRETFRFSAPLVLAPVLFAVASALWVDAARAGDALAGLKATFPAGTWAQVELGTLLSAWSSPGNGLVWMAPGLLLVPFGLWSAWSAGERLWPALALLSTPAVALVAHGAGQPGPDESYGPASLVPLVAVLWLGVPLALDLGPRVPPLRALAGLCFALGLLIALPGVLVSGGAYRALALAAGAEALPPGVERADLWRALHDDWSFASPWVRWRILRSRISSAIRASRGEEAHEHFRREELFHLWPRPSPRLPWAPPLEGEDEGRELRLRLAVASPAHREFAHLAWWILPRERGLPRWPVGLLVAAGLLLGLLLRREGLDPGHD